MYCIKDVNKLVGMELQVYVIVCVYDVGTNKIHVFADFNLGGFPLSLITLIIHI